MTRKIVKEIASLLRNTDYYSKQIKALLGKQLDEDLADCELSENSELAEARFNATGAAAEGCDHLDKAIKEIRKALNIEEVANEKQE